MKKCPFCAENIQSDAKKCKHCGEWLSESKSAQESDSHYSRLVSSIKDALPIKIDDLLLHKEYFLHAKRYSYNDVIGLTFSHSISSNTVGLQRVDSISLLVHTRDGIGACAFDFGRYAKKAAVITRAYEILRVLTIQSRYAYYVSQLRNKGFIDYEIKKDTGAFKLIKTSLRHIGKSANEYADDLLASKKYVHICLHKDGTVSKGSKKVYLPTAKNNDGILLGNRKAKFLNLWEAIGPTPLTRNPYQIALSETGLGLLSNKIVFEATRDFDIIAAIIADLASGKSF